MKLNVLVENVWILFFTGFLSSPVNSANNTQICKYNEWSCDEGFCIDAKLKCNGAKDCPDGSDETFVRCRNEQCTGFKCLYGGCVAGSATCDGVRDCADGSDELLLKCRNETTYRECIDAIPLQLRSPEKLKRIGACSRQRKICKNGQVLKDRQKCDGRVDCEDGSDETLETCATDVRWCNETTIGLKFRCAYGACVDQTVVCDGVKDCADSSDELHGLCSQINNNDGKWECDDGTTIDGMLKCNGAVDCPDGSDETFLNCRSNECPLGFRCVYGGCIRNNATCDGVADCADNSDELLTRCRNETTFAECFNKVAWLDITTDEQMQRSYQCFVADRKCRNGQELRTNRLMCDGIVHCDDGSDESLETCATDRHYCAFLKSFRCAYGACIEPSKVCNKKKDCADGSDELDDMCNKGKCVLPEYPEHGNYTVVDVPQASPGQVLRAVLMVYSCEDGYRHSGASPYVICARGSWSDRPLKCIAQCSLTKHPSLVFWCHSDSLFEVKEECGDQVLEGMTVEPECREPNYYYPEGVLSYMYCVGGSWDRPVPTCSPRCGLVTPSGDSLIINGTTAKRGKLPWHVGVYRKLSRPYEQICGGSLITDTKVLTAAHCFWSDLEKLLPAENYAVALGKLYRPWNDPKDIDAQKSNIQEIIIPPYFHGAKVNYQDDIALVVLQIRVRYGLHVRPVCVDFDYNFERKQLKIGELGTVTAHCFWSDLEKLLPAENYAVALGKLYRPWNDPKDIDAQKSNIQEIIIPPYFHGAKVNYQDDIALVVLQIRVRYGLHVRPVCVDFDYNFERKQLKIGELGTVAGWGLTAEDGKASAMLKVTRLPYIDINRCYKESPPAFYMYITSDKFCAGMINDTTLCHGDSGGGLVFSTRERNQERYYLRGVVSTKAKNAHRCNVYVHTTFTQVSKHQAFLQEHWN